MRDDNWIKTSATQGRQMRSGWEVETNQKSSTELGNTSILFEACNNSGRNLQDIEQSIYVYWILLKKATIQKTGILWCLKNWHFLVYFLQTEQEWGLALIQVVAYSNWIHITTLNWYLHGLWKLKHHKL